MTNGETQGCDDSNPAQTFGAAARVIEELGLGFLELREPGPDGPFGRTDVSGQRPLPRQIYSGALVLNSDYDTARAANDIKSKTCDAGSFWRPYVGRASCRKRGGKYV